MVYSRESITTEYLKKLNHKNYKVKADMGFMLEGNTESVSNISKYIAVTIINWQFLIQMTVQSQEIIILVNG